MLEFVFFVFAGCWTPAFHQGFAMKYAEVHYPNISSDQRNSFLLGSMYADGIDKSISHFVRPIIRELNSITNRQSNLYWFFLGVLNHIAIDTFAHAGKEKSFLLPSGKWHHLGELTICAWAHKNLHPSFRLISQELRNQIQGVGIGFRKSFKILYPFCYFITKIPFHYILLPFIEKDGCPKTDYKTSECNFLRHYNAMMKAAKEIMDHAHDSMFNEIDVKQITLTELQKIECCGGTVNITTSILENYPNPQEFPYFFDTQASIL